MKRLGNYFVMFTIAILALFVLHVDQMSRERS